MFNIRLIILEHDKKIQIAWFCSH